MKRSLLLAPILAVAAILTSSPAAVAETDVRVLRTLPLEGTPLDVAIAADGSQIFVLVEGGRLLIYGPDGNLRDRAELGTGVDRMALSPRGDGLIVSSSDGKTARVVLLETTQRISAEGAPFRGPVDAPVTVAVFSDFQ